MKVHKMFVDVDWDGIEINKKDLTNLPDKFMVTEFEATNWPTTSVEGFAGLYGGKQ